jgi:two-component system response regulator PilR (NtrC family)
LHRALALNEGNEFELDTLDDETGDLAEASTTESDLPVAALRADAPPMEATSAPPGSVPEDLQAYLDTQEREILVKVLEETQFNRTAAAARLKLSLRQIRYRIARLNIPMPSGADESSNDVA